jgi:hypothetical protein
VYRCVHGQRVISHLNYEPLSTSSKSIDILDFSLAATLSVKSHFPIDATDSENYKEHEYPYFMEDVRTYLPYVRITRGLKQEYSKFMVHADDVVCTKVRSQLPSYLNFIWGL